MKKLSETEKLLINHLQDDLPLVKKPFLEISKKLKISELELLKKINIWKKEGIIRRFGAVLNHHKIGMNANAMSVWEVPEDKIKEVSEIMCSIPEITHCYERATNAEWKYNVFAMIHSSAEDECRKMAETISLKTGIINYELIYSEKEYKKISPIYF